MRRAIPAILFVLAFCVPVLAQPAPFVAQEPETIHSDADLDRKIPGETVQAVLDPVYGVDGQYARWKKPLCFNVYGLKPAAKYFVEWRMREIARQVGAPVDRHDPCAPNATIIFTTSTKATLDSIEKALPRMLLVDYGFIRNRLKESQPIQA